MRLVPSMSHRLLKHQYQQQQQREQEQEQEPAAQQQSHLQGLPYRHRFPVATAGDGSLDAGDWRDQKAAVNGTDQDEDGRRGTNFNTNASNTNASSRPTTATSRVSRPAPAPAPVPAFTVSSTLTAAPAEPSTHSPATPKKQSKILPRGYERCDTSDLVLIISSMLMELIAFNDKLPLQEGCLTRFHSRAVPRMSLCDYLQRLATHATLSPPLLLSMVFFIDRLCALRPNFSVTNLTVHRFLISAATVASKGLSDSFWTNKTYAKVGGVSVAELSMLELELLFGVDWRIVPSQEELRDYYFGLVDRCDGFELEQES